MLYVYKNEYICDCEEGVESRASEEGAISTHLAATKAPKIMRKTQSCTGTLALTLQHTTNRKIMYTACYTHIPHRVNDHLYYAEFIYSINLYIY